MIPLRDVIILAFNSSNLKARTIKGIAQQIGHSESEVEIYIRLNPSIWRPVKNKSNETLWVMSSEFRESYSS